MLSFIRSEIHQLNAYQPHPGGETGEPVVLQDRLDTNESPYDLPSDLKLKLADLYQEIESNRYPDGGQLTLKQAIADYVNESAPLTESAAVTAAHLSVGNGSDELIRSILIATCLGGEGSVLVANPTFSMYGIIAQTLGIPVVSVGRSPETFEIDLAAAETAIAQTQNPPVRVVFVVHPNSPTANLLTPREIDWLRQLPPKILVVIDEAYFEFSQTTLLPELHQHPNWVILRTFSKAFRLAAHRVGYALAAPEVAIALEKVRLPYNLPSYSQTAALVALTHRSLLLSAIPEILAEREHLLQSLSNAARLQVWPSRANFIFVRPHAVESQSAEAIAEQICQTLKTQGTLIRHTGGGLRITIGTPAENRRTLERLSVILNS